MHLHLLTLDCLGKKSDLILVQARLWACLVADSVVARIVIPLQKLWTTKKAYEERQGWDVLDMIYELGTCKCSYRIEVY